jgi:ABC-type uncharacterized transport system fused permease/ATPase subunit
MGKSYYSAGFIVIYLLIIGGMALTLRYLSRLGVERVVISALWSVLILLVVIFGVIVISLYLRRIMRINVALKKKEALMRKKRKGAH